MRAVVQRVSQASVTVREQIIGQIGQGLLIFLGVGREDSETQVKQLAAKIVQLRIFSDEEGKMNRSLLDVRGEALIISQFTLFADMKRGRRPSFINAAPPEIAEALYERFKEAVNNYGITVASGIFGASMSIALHNEGPVTIWLDTAEI